MSRKAIYECERCLQFFSGKVAYDYHMNAHRRTDPPKKKDVAPRRARVYTGEINPYPEGDTE